MARKASKKKEIDKVLSANIENIDVDKISSEDISGKMSEINDNLTEELQKITSTDEIPDIANKELEKVKKLQAVIDKKIEKSNYIIPKTKYWGGVTSGWD